MAAVRLLERKIVAHPSATDVGDYRKLIVWQRARAFSARTREMVDTLPPTERARIGDQIIRAADSIRFTIVEGASFNNDRQFARFLAMALASANEVQDELDSLREAGMLTADYADLPGENAELRAMLAVLHRRVAPKKKTRAS